ncbi:hypothetical protein FA15DRAFT_672040 [Coprinopsis marcescibilis]|uniref:Uncharacterized protein n=1 Tax=Coprinopsis marcescibilis TaxID=230819 RepID=A0A5C3KP20_COPMA|nr:hypothetical protein FA15DRAFT_672040 [Coprinopsis marcescibilis]
MLRLLILTCFLFALVCSTYSLAITNNADPGHEVSPQSLPSHLEGIASYLQEVARREIPSGNRTNITVETSNLIDNGKESSNAVGGYDMVNSKLVCSAFLVLSIVSVLSAT